MKGKAVLFFLTTGMVLYILDLASDVFLAVEYYINDESKWFACTLGFIVVTVVITNITICMYASSNSFEGPCYWLWVFCSGCPIVFRYLEELTHWKRTNLDNSLCGQGSQDCACADCKSYVEQKRRSDKSTYSLAWLHFIQTLTQSAPQFCLQVYIMLNGWNFPHYTVLSAALSFISLTCSITALEKARETKNENPIFKLSTALVFLAWQFFSLISRLIAIVIFAYVFGYHVLTILALHWLASTVVIAYHRKDEFKGETVAAWFGMIIASWFCVFPLLVFASESLLAFFKNRRVPTFIAASILAFENILMLALSVAIWSSDSTHMDLLKPIAFSCVLGGLALGTVFCALYYRCCCRIKCEETEDTNESSLDNKGFKKEEC